MAKGSNKQNKWGVLFFLAVVLILISPIWISCGGGSSGGGGGSSSPHIVTAVASATPISGSRQTVFSLEATSSTDSDGGPLSFEWSVVEGASVTISPSSTAAAATFLPADDYLGDYLFSLRAYHGETSDSATIRITVGNHPPTAIASVSPGSGPRKTIFTLDAGLSSDPDADPLAFQWEQLSGPSVLLQPSGTAASPSFVPDSGFQGDYLFGLVVGDGLTPQAGATVRVTVTNEPPVVVMASNAFAYPGQKITLDASGSFDPDADPITLDWIQLAGATVTLDLTDPLRPAFASTVIASYTFQATANDGLVQAQAQITAHLISPKFKFAPSSGQNRVLVILANFADTTPAFNTSDFQNLLFADTALTMRDYYKTVSYHNLDLIGDFVGWINLSQPKSYYSNNNYGIDVQSYPKNLWALVEEAVDQAEAMGVDFSNYDNDGDGWVDSLIVVHQGRGSQESGLVTDLNTSVYALSMGRANPRYYDGVKIEYFALVQEQGRPDPVSGALRLVPFAYFGHEYGHLLGITDSYSSYTGYPFFLGLGRYDMMAYGVYGGDSVSPYPRKPVQMDAFHKSRMGWLEPVVVTADTTVVIPAMETSPFALKIPAGPDEREYYLLENRQRIGYDEKLSSQGLFIAHVDETPYWQNTEADTVHASPNCSYPAGETKWKHSMVMYEQPDGKFHLEGGANVGDTVDSWRPGQEFGGFSKPASLRYDCYPSGIKVSQIAESGSTVSARIELGRRQSDLVAPKIIVAQYGFSPASPSEGDTDFYADPGETLDFSIKLMNLGTGVNNLSLQYSSTSLFIEILENASGYPSLAPGDSAYNIDPLRLRIKPSNAGEVPAVIKLVIVADGVTYNNKFMNVSLGVPGVMMVDDDGGAKAEQKMMLELGRMGYLWTAWETAKQGEPSLEEMLKHRLVLWITGPVSEHPLGPSEISLLGSYLDAGGKLILSSQYLLVNPSEQAATFARDYLRVDSWQDDDNALQYLWPDSSSPISSGFTGRKMWTINYYPLLPRTVALTPAPDAISALKNDRMHSTMVQYSRSDGYGIIFSSFGLEHFSYADGTLLKRILNGASYIPGQPVITKVVDPVPTNFRPRSYGVNLLLEGIDFSAQTEFSFPEGGVNILSKSYNATSKRVTLSLQVMFNAPPGYHLIQAQNPGGAPVVYDRYFAVAGLAFANTKPVAIATASPLSGHPKTVFTLDGSQSSDADHEPIFLKWVQLQGPAMTLIPSSTAATVSFQPLNCYNGDYLFELKVWDGTTYSGDTVRVSTLNHAPVPVIEETIPANVDQPVMLDATSSYEPDLDLFSFEWAQLAGQPLSFDHAVLNPEIIPLKFEDYLFQLSLNDGCLISSKTILVKVNDPNNHLPLPMVAEAFVVGDSRDGLPLCFDGTPTAPDGLHDPVDGDTVYFNWELTSKPAGSAAVLNNPAAQMVCFNDDLPGYYDASLRVTDYTNIWSLPLYVRAYSMTYDLDNDLLPDEYELANGLEPADPADAYADPDLDGLASLHEYFNLTDPQIAEPWLLSIRDGAFAYAGGFFGDADGDLLYGATDLAALSSLLTGATGGYQKVYPPTGETHDFNGDGVIQGQDSVVFGEIFAGNTANFTGTPSKINLAEPASGATITLAVGATARITVQITDADGTPRSGSAAIFEVIQGSTTIQLLGGEGSSPARRNYQAVAGDTTEVRHFSPCLSPDGLEMFVSRWGDTATRYEIFYSTRASISQPFGPPTLVPQLGTTCDDFVTSMTGDGRELYFYRYNDSLLHPTGSSAKCYAVTPGLYVAHRAEGNTTTFDTIEPITELNESGNTIAELHPWISPDGLTLYYNSNRAGGVGGMDIWKATKASLPDDFGSPLNMGNTINTVAAERYPVLTADQLRIIFARRDGIQFDFYETVRADTTSPFAAPVKMTYLNRAGSFYTNEFTPFLSPDGRQLYFSYAQKTTTDYDIFLVERTILEMPFFVNWTAGRFDLTGKMALAAGDPNSQGKAFICVRMTEAGSAKLAVSIGKNSARLLPAAVLEKFITITAP